MARYVIDAATLLHLVDGNLPVDPEHQLVAPNSIRSEALQLLLDDVALGLRDEKDALALHERMTELKMRLLGFLQQFLCMQFISCHKLTIGCI